MKKIVTYFLFSMLSFAYCYESTKSLCKAYSSTYAKSVEDSDTQKDLEEGDEETGKDKLLTKDLTVDFWLKFDELTCSLLQTQYVETLYTVYISTFSLPPELI